MRSVSISVVRLLLASVCMSILISELSAAPQSNRRSNSQARQISSSKTSSSSRQGQSPKTSSFVRINHGSSSNFDPKKRNQPIQQTSRNNKPSQNSNNKKFVVLQQSSKTTTTTNNKKPQQQPIRTQQAVVPAIKKIISAPVNQQTVVKPALVSRQAATPPTAPRATVTATPAAVNKERIVTKENAHTIKNLLDSLNTLQGNPKPSVATTTPKPPVAEFPTIEDLKEVAVILGYKRERLVNLNKPQLLDLISKDPEPTLPAPAPVAPVAPAVISVPVPELQQTQPQQQRSPSSITDQELDQLLLDALSGKTGTDIQGLVSSLGGVLTPFNEVSPNGYQGSVSQEPPAQLFFEPSPVPSSLLSPQSQSVQQGHYSSAHASQRRQLEQHRQNQLDQQADLLRKAQIHQQGQLQQQEALLVHANQQITDPFAQKNAASLLSQLRTQQALNFKHLNTFSQPPQAPTHSHQAPQQVQQVQQTPQVVPQAPARVQAPTQAQAPAFDHIISEVFQFLEAELKSQQQPASSTNALNAEANAFDLHSQILSLLSQQNQAQPAAPGEPIASPLIAEPSIGQNQNGPATEVVSVNELLELQQQIEQFQQLQQQEQPNFQPAQPVLQQQSFGGSSSQSIPTGVRIPIDEFTRVAIYADELGKLHLQIDRGFGPPPADILPVTPAPPTVNHATGNGTGNGTAAADPEPDLREELVLQFAGTKVRVDLDGVQAFAPNSTNITANSTSTANDLAPTKHYRDVNNPLITITPAEFTRNLLVYYDLLEKIDQMNQGHNPDLTPRQVGAMKSGHLFDPTQVDPIAQPFIQQQQAEPVRLSNTQIQQVTANTKEAVNLSPLHENELRALAVVLGHPIESLYQLTDAELEKLISKDILLLSAQPQLKRR